MSHPIPDEALDDRLGFVGTAGSGKTYNSGGAVERILSRGGRVIIPDPLGVWWGLRLNSTGSAASPYSVVIFGGPHGDLPITEQSGAVIGETVAGMAESAIIDLSALGTKAGERRFMLAFLTALYARASGEPVHLILDEADLWAPQRILDREADAAKLLGQMETIVRRGRVKGFIPWLITQRPAVLSKDVLSQMDGLVAFKLTGPHDRAALGSWIEGQADKSESKAIDSTLPTLQRGQGIVWVPGRGVLTTSTFPPKATFDSSRTPKRGEIAKTAALKPIDLGKLKDRLAGVVAETKANDPKVLKARIAELERNTKSNAEFAPFDPRAIAAAEERGLAEGKRTAVSAFATLAGDLADAIGRTEEACGDARRLLNSFATFAETQAATVPSPPRQQQRAIPAPSRPVAVDEGPSRAHQKILDAVAWWNLFGVARPSQAQVAFVAGYSHKSGTWATYLSRLRSAGLIDGRGEIVLTADGRAVAAVSSLPRDGESFRSAVLDKIDGSLARILRPILQAYPDEISQASAGEAAGYSHSSGTWATYLSRLRSLDLIAGRGSLRASDWLFPESRK